MTFLVLPFRRGLIGGRGQGPVAGGAIMCVRERRLSDRSAPVVILAVWLRDMAVFTMPAYVCSLSCFSSRT